MSILSFDGTDMVQSACAAAVPMSANSSATAVQSRAVEERAVRMYRRVQERMQNVGFFRGAMLDVNPAELLEGAGKRMRHVKLRPAKN